MAQAPALNWQMIVADPRFQALHRKKTTFLWGLMVFSIIYYFLLPIGAAYFQDLYKIKVWGPVNVGLSVRAVGVHRRLGHRVYYSRRANAEFDPMAREICATPKRQVTQMNAQSFGDRRGRRPAAVVTRRTRRARSPNGAGSHSCVRRDHRR